jgi:hypothetical protein
MTEQMDLIHQADRSTGQRNVHDAPLFAGRGFAATAW